MNYVASVRELGEKPRLQAPPRFYLAAVEKNLGVAWGRGYNKTLLPPPPTPRHLHFDLLSGTD